jgi:hypothetical protein
MPFPWAESGLSGVSGGGLANRTPCAGLRPAKGGTQFHSARPVRRAIQFRWKFPEEVRPFRRRSPIHSARAVQQDRVRRAFQSSPPSRGFGEIASMIVGD